MHQWNKSDETLRHLYTQATERLGSYTPTHPQAAALKAMALDMMRDVPARLTQAIERAQQEAREAYSATQALRAAQEEAQAQYEALFHTIQSALYATSARDKAAGQTAREAMSRALADRSPGAVHAMGLDRTLDALQQGISAAATLLPAADPALVAATEAHAALRDAQAQALREAAESVEAVRALEDARDLARTHYVAARGMIEVAFYLDARDDLSRFVEPLHPPRRLPPA